MDESQVTDLAGRLDGVRILVAGSENGAPESAWGDTFFFYDPEGTENQKMPFVTIVTRDTPGWDEDSNLDRVGAFRVNVSIGREHVPEVTPDTDYAECDVLLPHPQYAKQGWVSVVNPGPRTESVLQDLVGQAHDRAKQRHTPG